MVLECFGNTYATDSQKSWSTGNKLAQKFDEIEEHFFTTPRLKQCFFLLSARIFAKLNWNLQVASFLLLHFGLDYERDKIIRDY